MHVLLVGLILVPAVATAQYKCVSPSGAVSFQQTPCASTQQQKRLDLKVAPAPAPSAASGAPAGDGASAGTVEQRMVRKMERDRKLLELDREIARTELTMNNRNAQMAGEMEALRSRKALARNNLAGATLEQSISTEMQAVAAKYKAMNDVDIERLKQLRAQREAMRQSAANQQGAR